MKGGRGARDVQNILSNAETGKSLVMDAIFGDHAPGPARHSRESSGVNNLDFSKFENLTTFSTTPAQSSDTGMSRSDKIDEILEIRFSLEQEKVKTTDIPHVDENSTDEQINRTFSRIKRRDIQNTYSGYAKDILGVGAELLSSTFDGNKEIFGISPDFTGIQHSLNFKLRKLKRVTGDAASSIIGAGEVSGLAQIMLEICPMVVMYPIQKKRSKPGSYTVIHQWDDRSQQAVNEAGRGRVNTAIEEV